MKRVTISAILLIVFFAGCEQIIGLDEMKTGPDGGPDGDSDTDIDGDGDDCTVKVLNAAVMNGFCIPTTAEPSECAGGFYPTDPRGSCPNDQLKCCIDTDQCEVYAPVTSCKEECDTTLGEQGWVMGCPDGQMCCSSWGV